MTSPESENQAQARAQQEAAPQQQQKFQEPETGRETQPREEGTRGREKTVGGKVAHLHTAHARVPIPYLTPGDMFRSGRATTSKFPSPGKLAFYGGLGAMALAGALEWPVAVAVGAATEVITREKRAEQARAEREKGQETRGETTGRAQPARPAEAAAG